MGKQPEQTFFQRGYINVQQVHEKVLNITNCMSKLQWDILSYLLWCLLLNRQMTCWWGYGEKKTFVHFWWGCKLVQALWETKWSFLMKLKIELPYDTAIPLLGIYPKEMKLLSWSVIYTPIAVLFTVAKIWKQSQCPSLDEWI